MYSEDKINQARAYAVKLSVELNIPTAFTFSAVADRFDTMIAKAAFEKLHSEGFLD